MNLTPKSWNMQSELTADTVEVNDIISYSDVENFIIYKVIEVTDSEMTIQDIESPEWIDVKSFEQLSKRWQFCLRDDRQVGEWMV